MRNAKLYALVSLGGAANGVDRGEVMVEVIY